MAQCTLAQYSGSKRIASWQVDSTAIASEFTRVLANTTVAKNSNWQLQLHPPLISLDHVRIPSLSLLDRLLLLRYDYKRQIIQRCALPENCLSFCYLGKGRLKVCYGDEELVRLCVEQGRVLGARFSVVASERADATIVRVSKQPVLFNDLWGFRLSLILVSLVGVLFLGSLLVLGHNHQKLEASSSGLQSAVATVDVGGLDRLYRELEDSQEVLSAFIQHRHVIDLWHQQTDSLWRDLLDLTGDLVLNSVEIVLAEGESVVNISASVSELSALDDLRAIAQRNNFILVIVELENKSQIERMHFTVSLVANLGAT